MKLTQSSPYLSIQNLPPLELPSLAILTGVNGSGKTHLLRAIENGHVIADCAPSPKEDIRFFDWNNLVPNSASRTDITQVYSERDQICQLVQQNRNEREQILRSTLSKFGKTHQSIKNIWSLTGKSIDDLENILGNRQYAEAAHQAITNESNNVTNKTRQKIGKNQRLRWLIDQLVSECGSLAKVDENYFSNRPFGWDQENLFQQSFAQMFLAYFDLERTNRLRKLAEQEGQKPDIPSLSRSEFKSLHGEPPWDFVNQMIRQAGLGFHIDHPYRLDSNKYSPELRKLSSESLVDFTNLSSGEKILMSFAFCLYYSIDNRQSIERPKLLLFDEIDAPLHPSMSRILMQTIESVLVKQQGINVIFVTHSPSTVAVAPDVSIHVMEPDTNQITKETKHKAVAILTSEIPTLAISFDGRRQVFVESQRDAERYERLYRIYSQNISTERSLVFIGVGGRSAAGTDDSTGCDQVKRIVNELSNGGNISVFGLIDWDGKNRSDGKVLVLAENRRYAIENCLLDPILVGAAAIRSNSRLGSAMGLSERVTYTQLSDLGQDDLQTLSSTVQRRILGADDLSGEEHVVSRYVNGQEFSIARQYAEMSGHELEGRVFEAFPELNGACRRGNLLMHIVDPVMVDYPDFGPIELIEVFERLTCAEVH